MSWRVAAALTVAAGAVAAALVSASGPTAESSIVTVEITDSAPTGDGR